MTYQEMVYQLEMCGFSAATLRCIALAHEGGATDKELEGLYFDLMSE